MEIHFFKKKFKVFLQLKKFAAKLKAQKILCKNLKVTIKISLTLQLAKIDANRRNLMRANYFL